MFEKFFNHILDKPLLNAEDIAENEEQLETGFENDSYIQDPEYTGKIDKNKFH